MPVSIKANRDGFRRCGIAHSDQWVEHPDGRFTSEEIEILSADTMLQVKITKKPAAPATPPSPGPQGDAGPGDQPPSPGPQGDAGSGDQPPSPDKGKTSKKGGK
ncbi:HI1506-related protein [Desulfovibrio aminophilus]|uniref:HI1506-related protein n=1 Tax=Desulfovibrio aminophilus TaxID=81425 RepID=UPI00041270CA|nr:HI1506-related protein [Desulfovibrio aminophilus]